MHSSYYIGIMSGTSCDGVDTVLTRISAHKTQLIGTHFAPFDRELKQDILQLCVPGDNAIERLGHCDQQLGQLYATSVHQLLDACNVPHNDIRAIGCHGQTIRHRPNSPYPFTVQIGDPNQIAAITGIDTVADFRRRDMALGGQGAPLMPAFHAALVPQLSRPAWVINIGGMANVTHLNHHHTPTISGYDIGPGNVLLDAHYQLHHPEQSFDKDGSWAKRGKVNRILLQQMLNDHYFSLPAPKSTGREHFNAAWLKQQIKLYTRTMSPEDIQRTLIELTAQTIAAAVGSSTAPVWICGGGAKNTLLMERIQTHINGPVADTTALGIAPEWVEAAGLATSK